MMAVILRSVKIKETSSSQAVITPSLLKEPKMKWDPCIAAVEVNLLFFHLSQLHTLTWLFTQTASDNVGVPAVLHSRKEQCCFSGAAFSITRLCRNNKHLISAQLLLNVKFLYLTCFACSDIILRNSSYSTETKRMNIQFYSTAWCFCSAVTRLNIWAQSETLEVKHWQTVQAAWKVIRWPCTVTLTIQSTSQMTDNKKDGTNVNIKSTRMNS